MKAKTLLCAIGIAGLLCTPGMLHAQATGANTPPAAGGLPAVIPIFPLPTPTLFPNASHAFFIFEPRYRVMVADALKGDRIIGMVMLQPGFEADYEGRPPIFPIGCAGLITEHEELPDGRFTIVLGGLAKFRVTSEDASRAYRLARVAVVPEVLDTKKTIALAEERERMDGLLVSVFAQLGLEPPPAGIPDEQLVDELSQHLPMEPLDRQRLLEREDPLSRARALMDLLDRMTRVP